MEQEINYREKISSGCYGWFAKACQLILIFLVILSLVGNMLVSTGNMKSNLLLVLFIVVWLCFVNLKTCFLHPYNATHWLYVYLVTCVCTPGVTFDLLAANGPKSWWSFGARDCAYVQDWQKQVRSNCQKLDPEICYGLVFAALLFYCCLEEGRLLSQMAFYLELYLWICFFFSPVGFRYVSLLKKNKKRCLF